MGRTRASCSHPRRTVSRKRYSARASHPGEDKKRLSSSAGKSAKRSPNKRRDIKPHRSEADLDLARRMLAALQGGTDMRLRKVRRLRAAIKVRAYENDLKFQIALHRMRATVEG